jgi:hypothetical protein
MHFQPWHYIMVYGQLHAFAALPLWQEPLVPTGMVGPRIALSTKKGENFASAGNQKTISQVTQPVAQPLVTV